MVDVGQARARLVLDTTGFKAGMVSATKDLEGFKGRTGVLGKAVAGFGKLVKRSMLVAGAGVTALGVSSVKTGMKFDAAMSQVAATLGKSTKDIGKLRDAAIEMGEKTKFSATEAAEALNYMALAGYDDKTSIEMLPKVLSLAAAGNMDLAKASDMVTDSQTALGLSLDRTGQMVDEMAKAASTGNTSVEQMGEAFLTVGGLAKELNGGLVKLKDGTKAPVDGLQEMEIALTAMANAGVKGSEAGTHMRNMLLKLSSPTDAGAKAFKQLGVNVFDTEGNMRSLSDIFGDLNTSLGNLTQEEKLQAISKIFNARDTASAEALLGAISQDWDKIGESILGAQEASVRYEGKLYSMDEALKKFGKDIYDTSKGFEIIGAAEQMAGTQMDNLAGDVTLFKDAFGTLQIAISDVSKGALRNFVQEGTKGIGMLTKAVKSGDFTGIFKAIPVELNKAKESLIAIIPQVAEVGSKLIVDLTTSMASNLPKLTTELVNGAYTAITIALDTIKQVITSIDFPAVISKSLDFVTTLTADIKNKAGSLIDSGIELVLKLAQGFADSLPAIFEKVPTIISNIANIINENAPKLLMAGVQIVAKIAIGLVKSIPTIVQNVPKIIKAIWDVWNAVNWVSLGIKLVTGIINGIKSMIGKLPAVAGKIVSTIWNVLKSMPTRLGNLGVAMIQGLGSGMRGMLGLLGTVAKSLLTVILNVLKSLPSKLLSIGGTAIKFLVKGIKSFWNLIISTMQNLSDSMVKSIKKIPSKFLSIGKDIVNGLIKGIKGKIGGAVDAIKGLGSKMFNGIKDAFDIHSPSKKMERKVAWELVNGLVKGIEGKGGKAVKSAEKMSVAIVKAATNKLAALKSSKNWEIDAKGEANYWKSVMESMKKGTSGYTTAYNKYQAAVNKANKQAEKEKKEYNKKMTELEKDYTNKVEEIYSDLKKQIDELNAKYEEAYKNRVSEILSATSTFGKYVDPAVEAMSKAEEAYTKAKETFAKASQEFASGKITIEEFTEAQKEMTAATNDYNNSMSEYTAQGLIDNLQSQVDAIAKYNEEITKLEGKEIIPSDLLENIKGMGLDATKQIELLNGMTDEELDKYVSLWKEKNELARTQAEQELKPLEDAIAKEIASATKKADNKLNKLKETYIKKMKKIGTDGKTAGKNAGAATVNGLISGLNSKKSDLSSTLSTIYATVKSKVDAINALMASAGSAAGGGGGGSNSHAAGLNYVPYNGYNARLHEGETVLPRNEAEAYRRGNSGNANYNFTFNSPEAINPYEANKLFKETVRRLNEGFV